MMKIALSSIERGLTMIEEPLYYDNKLKSPLVCSKNMKYMLTSVEGDAVGCDDLHNSAPSIIVSEGEVVTPLKMLL